MNKQFRRTTRLETALNAVQTPVFILDARRKVLFLNSGFESLTGWTPEEVTGRTCDYVSDADHSAVESLTGLLAPPPEVLAGKAAHVPVKLLERNGQTADRRLHFYPLMNHNGQVEHILGVVTPIHQPAAPAETTPIHRLHAELATLRVALRRRFGIKSLICRGAAMRRVVRQIKLAETSNVGIFFQGEVGTGKEHIARLIHLESELGNRSFVPLDCRGLSPFELKQTLRRLLDGTVEKAETTPLTNLQPGTIFLSHVDFLPRDLQEMLVKWYGDHEVSEVVQLRIMASSTADIEPAVESGAILSDFFCLLTTIPIQLPPLRRRREELPLLAQSFLEELNRDAEKQVGGFGNEVWDQFREYNWPGNLDQLSRVVAEARQNCTGDVIQALDLPFRFRTGLDAQSVGPPIRPQTMPLAELLEKVEAEQIRFALEQTRHNRSQAAGLLGITRARLYRRMEALGIDDVAGPKL